MKKKDMRKECKICESNDTKTYPVFNESKGQFVMKTDCYNPFCIVNVRK